MKPFKIKFTATGGIIDFIFSETPKLTDIFLYQEDYYMVVDYDGKFVHVVHVNKLEILV